MFMVVTRHLFQNKNILQLSILITTKSDMIFNHSVNRGSGSAAQLSINTQRFRCGNKLRKKIHLKYNKAGVKAKRNPSICSASKENIKAGENDVVMPWHKLVSLPARSWILWRMAVYWILTLRG